MAVQPQTPYQEDIANGVTTVFPLQFDCDNKDHLIVLIDGVEADSLTWSLANKQVIFTTAPALNKKITFQRNTPYRRDRNYQSYDNSFRPDPVNKDFDWIWLKLQELGVADWILGNRIAALKSYMDKQDGQLQQNIDNLKDYVDLKDDELEDYLMEEIRKQGVALDQLDEYYNYLMERLAQIAIDNGWDASLVTYDGKTQKEFNDSQKDINSRTATPYDFGAIGDGLAHPLSERYATLAEAKVIYPSATSLSEYIDGHALNKWWRDICANNRNYATCHGKFVCNTKISNLGLNSISNIIKTRHINFNADIKFSGLVAVNGFEIISPRQCEFSGFINIYDAASSYDLRTVENLIYIEDFIHAAFNWKVVAKNAKNLGLLAFSGAGSLSGGYANNNASDLGDWQFGSCGHRFSHHTYSFATRSDIGDPLEPNQRTALTLDTPHNLDDLVDSIINFKNKPYLITASSANSITVYPWLYETDLTGTFGISKGGDFRLVGADSNNIKMSSGSTDCAICAGGEGFFVGAKLQRTNEANDVGLRLGGALNNAQIGGTYLGLYFESNVFDVVKTSLNADDALLINPIALDLNKCHVLTPISSVTREPNYYLISPPSIHYGKKSFKTKVGQYGSGVNPTTTITVELGSDPIKIRGNTPIVTLSDAPNIRRIFGNVDIDLEFFGTATNNGTTGSTTIKCEAGYKINNVAADFIIPTSNSAFKVSARLVSETDWRVSIYYASRRLQASVVYDPASLAANEIKTWNVTLTGAVKGETVVAAFDGSLNGTVILDAQVTSNNLVTVYHWNPTTAAVDVASGNLTVKLV